MNESRLDQCGWGSFREHLFLKEPGRLSRDVGNEFVRLLRDFSKGSEVLELCCGSGVLVADIARAGYQVTGLDLSESMLRGARERIAAQPPSVRDRIRLIRADMCTFDLCGVFDFIILEDDGFEYLLSQEDQLACLDMVRRHLADGGLFFLGFTTPQRELDVGYCRQALSSGVFEYDPITQVKTAECEWTVVDERGERTTVKEGFERRKLTYPCELRLLLRAAGLEALHRWGDLNRTPFSDPSHQDYNYLIRKAKPTARTS